MDISRRWMRPRWCSSIRQARARLRSLPARGRSYAPEPFRFESAITSGQLEFVDTPKGTSRICRASARLEPIIKATTMTSNTPSTDICPVSPDYGRLDLPAPCYQDPHELAHANDIRRRFANREVTTGQIVVFGLTGGLIPCPASISVLLLCLQLKRVTLGATLVLCFSIGLALTMVVSGAPAALSVRHVSRRWSGFGDFARKAPYISGIAIALVGLFVGYQGAVALG